MYHFVCKECDNWCMAGAMFITTFPDHCFITPHTCKWEEMTEEDVKELIRMDEMYRRIPDKKDDAVEKV